MSGEREFVGIDVGCGTDRSVNALWDRQQFVKETTWRDCDERGYLGSLQIWERDDDRPLSDFHGGFIPQVPESLILRLTHLGGNVLDPMAGSGTTGLVAARLGRRCIMSDLTPQNADIWPGDARKIKFPPDLWFDLIILHPPYHYIVQFSDKREDLSQCPTVEDFMVAWREVVANVTRSLRLGGYIAIVIGDVWITRKRAKETGDLYGLCPLGFKTMNAAMEVMRGGGLDPVLTSIVVKNITGNRKRAHQINLDKARAHAAGGVIFGHEYVITMRRGR